MNRMTSIELFAGAGGLALGLEFAGFNHIGLVEIDKFACSTLKKNRPLWNVLEKDITTLTEQDLKTAFNVEYGDLDLLSGGCPCQSFSYAGKKLGLEDTRGTMFYYYAKFLKTLKPKMFLFENVRGLISHNKGKTFKIICETLENCGYSLHYKVLNALNYGVAQKRERLFIIGIRKDLNYFFNFPKPLKNKKVLKDILLDVPKSLGAEYSPKKKEIFNLVPAGGYWRDIDPQIAKEYMKSSWGNNKGGRTGILRRLSLDEPSLTILTTPQMKQTDRCHPLEVRPFNIRESARIQSFPDEWEFVGSVAQQYKQIGNAVPPLLAEAVGKEIVKTLNKDTHATRFLFNLY